MKKCLLIHSGDNVAVMLEDGKKGDEIQVNGQIIHLLEDIPFGHKVCLYDMKPEDLVYKYGEEIGYMMTSVPVGTWIHNHNMGCRRGKM